MSSNRDKGNSFWRRNGSNGDNQSAPSGSAQPNSSSAFKSGWGRPPSSSDRPTAGSGGLGRPSSSNPQASGGSGWGRQGSFNRPAAGGGAARPSSPPNFTVVLIAALLLLPGVTQPIADEFTQAYIQTNRIIDPHTQDDIDRAIAAFHRKHQQKAPAPPEGYTPEHVIHCFHQKYELPENLRETFEGFVQSYITKNQKPFTMKLQTAVDRALLHIYEFISKENSGPIPEKDSRPPPPAPAPAPSPSLQPPPPHFRNHGERILEEVIAHGLSPKTIGHEMFHKLMHMKNGPQSDHIWAFKSCPDPRTLIRALSFKGGVAGISYISCFISGFIIEPNGKLVQFNYPNFDNPMIGWKRDDLFGKPVIIWISEVGQVIYTKTERQFDAGQYDYTLGVGRKGAGYSGESISYDHQGNVCTFAKLKHDALNQEMSDDRRAFFAREHVTAPERENLNVGKNHSLDREIRSDPEYQAACKEAIAQIGGIPVSLYHSHQEATAAEGSDHCGAAAPDDAVMIFCYHRNCVMSHGNYTPCLDCKRHPGKQPIMDGWCTEVVGYRQKP